MKSLCVCVQTHTRTHTEFGVVYCQWELAFSYTCHPSSQTLLVSKLSIQSRLKSMTDWAARWTFSNHWFHHGVPVHKHPQQLTLAWNGDHIPQADRQNFWWMHLNLHSSRSKPRIMLVCGHSPVKLPLGTHLRVQPDCMHSFPPGGVTGSIWEETDWMARRRFWQHVWDSWRSQNLMVRNRKGRPSMGDGGFPGKWVSGTPFQLLTSSFSVSNGPHGSWGNIQLSWLLRHLLSTLCSTCTFWHTLS